MKISNGIKHLAETIQKDIVNYVPNLFKNPTEKLALLTATMLIERTANTVDLAAALPLETERLDMRYQWISRLLASPDLDYIEVMQAFAERIIHTIVDRQHPVVILIDQTTASNGHEILMISLRMGERALPFLWVVKKTEGNIGFEEQKTLLNHLDVILPEGAKVLLMGDRFYGTCSLVDYCTQRTWSYRLRLKGNINIQIASEIISASQLATREEKFLTNVFLATSGVKTNIGFIHEAGHPEPWIIIMDAIPDRNTTLDYGKRWSIESLFSDFKTRGFGLEDTQMRLPDRLSRLILVMALAIYYAVNAGVWDEENNPTSIEKKRSRSTT